MIKMAKNELSVLSRLNGQREVKIVHKERHALILLRGRGQLQRCCNFVSKVSSYAVQLVRRGVADVIRK